MGIDDKGNSMTERKSSRFIPSNESRLAIKMFTFATGGEGYMHHCGPQPDRYSVQQAGADSSYTNPLPNVILNTNCIIFDVLSDGISRYNTGSLSTDIPDDSAADTGNRETSAASLTDTFPGKGMSEVQLFIIFCNYSAPGKGVLL